MRLAKLLSALCVVALTSLACAGLTAVPPPSEDYVGTWSNHGEGGVSIELRITPGGQVEWSKDGPGTDLSLAGPATEWTDDTITCCLGFGELQVQSPPTEGPQGWTMTVDGAILRRP